MARTNRRPYQHLGGTRSCPELTVRPARRVSFAAVYRSSYFDRFSKRTARSSGHPIAFVAAFGLIVGWLITGPIFGFSATWQLVINTATTIVTFLMVFLIQNTQNRDGAAVQLKLDELIRSTQGAHNAVLDLEELSEDELEAFHEKYLELAEAGREEIRSGAADTGTPTIQFPSPG
jgi:low affinity Fe/Cu permease